MNGLMRSNKVNAPNVPDDITRLVIRWCGDIEGWDIKTNRDDWEMIDGLRVCTRIERSKYIWILEKLFWKSSGCIPW